MPNVIGFAAQARNGKDVAADYIAEKLKWKKIAFASSLKRILSENFGVSLEFIEEWKIKNEIPEGFQCTIREALIKIGDGWRQIKKNIWIETLFNNLSENCIIGDCRYDTEARKIREHGFTVLIWRPGYENNIQNGSEQEVMKYIKVLKETPSGIIKINDIPYDIWIKNDDDLESFHKKLDDIVLPYAKLKFNL